MNLLDKLRVILHEEGDGLHQLRLGERSHLGGGRGRHSVVHQAGAGALSGSAAGESLGGEQLDSSPVTLLLLQLLHLHWSEPVVDGVVVDGHTGPTGPNVQLLLQVRLQSINLFGIRGDGQSWWEVVHLLRRYFNNPSTTI